MMLTCTIGDRSAYETGRLTPGDGRLFRPGGLDLTERAIALVNFDAGAMLLDLGCGAGVTVRYLRSQGFRAMGIDCAPNPVPAKASVRGPVTRIVARAEDLPFADGAIDGILAECSFSLFEDRQCALAECTRVLIDGGRLMISDLYARCPEAIAEVRALRSSCAANILVREELEADLWRAGFTVNVWEDHSRSLRECAARYLFEHGSLDGLWGCGGNESSRDIDAAMRAARAGYFLLIATRRNRDGGKGNGAHE